jgi:hypothetical protein
VSCDIILQEGLVIQTYMLSELLNSLEHTTDEVGSHEGLGKLVSVFVSSNPEGVLLLDFVSDDVGPKVLDRFVFVVVGVESLPGVHVAAWLGKAGPWVDWLVLLGGGWSWGSGGGSSLLLLLDFLLRGLLGCVSSALSGNFGVLLGVEGGFLDGELDATDDSGNSWLVDGRQEPSVDMWEGLSPFGGEHLLVAGLEGKSDGDISIGDSLANEEGASGEVAVHEVECLFERFLGLTDVLLVLRDDAESWPNPLGDGGEEDVVGESGPAENVGSLGAASGLFITDKMGDSVVVAESGGTILEGGNFSEELGLELGSLVGDTVDVVRGDLKEKLG